MFAAICIGIKMGDQDNIMRVNESEVIARSA